MYGLDFDFDKAKSLIGSRQAGSPPLSKLNLHLQPLIVGYDSQWGDYHGLVVSSAQGMLDIKEAVGKKDIGFVSAFVYDPVQGKEDSARLASDISAAGFPIIRILGTYEYTDTETNERIGGSEWSFAVINNGATTRGFFQFVIGLGQKYNQHSVLLCPAEDLTVNRTVLEGRRGYLFFLSRAQQENSKKYQAGSFSDQGVFNSLSVDEWRALVHESAQAGNLATGSTTSGVNGEVFKFDREGGKKEEIKVWSGFNYRVDAIHYDKLDCAYAGIPARKMFPFRGSIDNGTHPICSSAQGVLDFGFAVGDMVIGG